jgi:cyclic pyranopterin phosphate synthase
MTNQTPLQERLAPHAHRVIAFSQEEVNTYRQRMVGTEHLLLGLFRASEGIAAQTLASFGVTMPRLRDAVELLVQDTFDLADRLRQAFGQPLIDTEHLLLALLEIPGNAALGVLQALGIEREYLRDRTFTFMRQPTVLDLPMPPSEPQLTHLDASGQAQMVDVGAKADSTREAIARGTVLMEPATLALIMSGNAPKGDVLAAARIAGIMAAKRTSDLIPLCHPLMLSKISVDITPDAEHNALQIEATVRTTGKTGVEMEALTAVSVAALTLYDMCKAVDRGMRLTDIRLAQKRGGASGEIVLE